MGRLDTRPESLRDADEKSIFMKRVSSNPHFSLQSDRIGDFVAEMYRKVVFSHHSLFAKLK